VPHISVSDDDYEFLMNQAELDGFEVDEYLALMIDRQRVIVKYKDKPVPEPPKAPSYIEPPHRKWGM